MKRLQGFLVGLVCWVGANAYAGDRDAVSAAADAPPQAGGAESLPRQTFRDCSDCPEMVVLPVGSFQMGSLPAEQAREGLPKLLALWESPQHSVTIERSFAIGKYLITRGEFSTFSAETGDDPKGCLVYVDGKAIDDISRNWRNPGFEQSDRDPVVCVSYDDALKYIAWLNKRTSSTGGSEEPAKGGPYRLPSESEWEYAARAGTNTTRYWGNSVAEACFFANSADMTTKELR